MKNQNSKPRLLGRRNITHSALNLVIVAVFLVAVILVNAICTLLVDRFNLRFDMTNEGVFTMSDTTKNYLSTLKNGVDIYVTLDEIYFTQSSDTSYKQVKYLLDQYELNSDGNVAVHYNSNLVNDTDFTTQFYYLSVSFGDVVVVSRNQSEESEYITNYRRFNLDDCFTTTSYSTSTYDISTVENSLTTAIMYLNEDRKKIAVTTGHNEDEFGEELKSLIAANIYSTTSVNLSMLASTSDTTEQTAEKTLSEYDVMVIYYPEYDFSEEEIELLDRFLENDGTLSKGLMVYVEPTTPSLPNLEEFLHEWGIVIDAGTVYDKERNFLGTYLAPRVMIPSEAHYSSSSETPTLDFISGNLYADVSTNATLQVVAPITRSLSIVDGYKAAESGCVDGRTVYKALATYYTAQRAPSVVEMDNSDPKDSYNTALISVKERVLNSKALTSSVFVTASASLFGDEILTNSIFANDRYFVELLNYQAHRKSSVVVSAKNITVATLKVTNTQSTVLAVLFIGILPIICFVAGVAVFFRRRHL